MAMSAIVVVLAHTTSFAILPFLAPVVVLGGALVVIVVRDRRRSRR
jgi:hypothetical protein